MAANNANPLLLPAAETDTGLCCVLNNSKCKSKAPPDTPSPSDFVEVFVDQGGNDDTGRIGAERRPFRNIHRAITALRKLGKFRRAVIHVSSGVFGCSSTKRGCLVGRPIILPPNVSIIGSSVHTTAVLVEYVQLTEGSSIAHLALIFTPAGRQIPYLVQFMPGAETITSLLDEVDLIIPPCGLRTAQAIIRAEPNTDVRIHEVNLLSDRAISVLAILSASSAVVYIENNTMFHFQQNGGDVAAFRLTDDGGHEMILHAEANPVIAVISRGRVVGVESMLNNPASETLIENTRFVTATPETIPADIANRHDYVRLTLPILDPILASLPNINGDATSSLNTIANQDVLANLTNQGILTNQMLFGQTIDQMPFGLAAAREEQIPGPVQHVLVNGTTSTPVVFNGGDLNMSAVGGVVGSENGAVLHLQDTQLLGEQTSQILDTTEKYITYRNSTSISTNAGICLSIRRVTDLDQNGSNGSNGHDNHDKNGSNDHDQNGSNDHHDQNCCCPPVVEITEHDYTILIAGTVQLQLRLPHHENLCDGFILIFKVLTGCPGAILLGTVEGQQNFQLTRGAITLQHFQGQWYKIGQSRI